MYVRLSPVCVHLSFSPFSPWSSSLCTSPFVIISLKYGTESLIVLVTTSHHEKFHPVQWLIFQPIRGPLLHHTGLFHWIDDLTISWNMSDITLNITYIWLLEGSWITFLPHSVQMGYLKEHCRGYYILYVDRPPTAWPGNGFWLSSK